MPSRLKFWSIITAVIFAILALWAFGVHESMHILACEASGLQGSLVDYRTGNCAGLDTASSWTFFLVKSAPYLADILAALLLWLLARRLDFIGLLRTGKLAIGEGGTATGRIGSKKSVAALADDSTALDKRAGKVACSSLRGAAIFAALNAWALAILFDVASNYAGSLIGFTDFLSIIAYDRALLVPAMVVTFVALLFACLFFWEEYRRIKPHLRGRGGERILSKINNEKRMNPLS